MTSDRFNWGKCRVEALSLLSVATAQLGICCLVRSTGFTAISDDDYARVVIAQRFAEAPSLDPSGTSWLPFPFWMQGLTMKLAGASLEVAQMTAVAAAIVSAFLLYAATRILGASRTASALAAVGAAAIPSGAYLAVATVPEYLTAALLTFSLCTLLETKRPSLTMLGAGALFLASASRYEVWPAAALFSIVVLFDTRKTEGRGTRWGAAALACAFPLIWISHGHVNHKNAFFFVQRVVDYKKALGASHPSGTSLALEYPRALILAEPELMFLVLGMAGAVALAPLRFQRFGAFRRVLGPLGAMFLTLVVGAVRGGAPTHHAERALLGIWFILVVGLAVFIEQNRKHYRLLLAVGLIYGALGGSARYAGAFERESFSNRKSELELGTRLRKETRENVGLALPDYGYFAVMAAAGNPSRFVVLDKHDPRERSPSTDPIQKWIESGGCSFVATEAASINIDSVLKGQVPPLSLRRAASCPPLSANNPRNSPELRQGH